MNEEVKKLEAVTRSAKILEYLSTATKLHSRSSSKIFKSFFNKNKSFFQNKFKDRPAKHQNYV